MNTNATGARSFRALRASRRATAGRIALAVAIDDLDPTPILDRRYAIATPADAWPKWTDACVYQATRPTPTADAGRTA